MTEGEKKETGGAEPRPYTRLPRAYAFSMRRRVVTPPYERLPITHTFFIRGDVGIAPYTPSTGGKNTFKQPAAKGRHLPLPLRGKGAI